MTEREKEKKNKKKEEDIKIDYDHIDVADIMDQIKRKVATEPKKPPQEEIQMKGFYQVPPTPLPSEPEEEPASGKKRKIKKILLKIMKPVSPIIKLLVLPVHEQIMQTDRKLHQTNRRLDDLNARLDQVLDKLSMDLNNLEKRLDLTYSDINEIMEYTKLLHNLSHNIVVELSKLKIEEENLKSKTRIMEKDFESLGRREKALEKKIFK